ncbi:MAG: hypothetical protein HYV97_11890 [Bdellovibrio sp.]|nr:hypothetical protein [Bdellovibrio sp.]
MKIPNFWIKVKHKGQFADGKMFEILKYGYSDDSLDRAREDAERRAAQTIERLSNSDSNSRRDEHRDYSLAQPIREEILHKYSINEVNIVITRNSYGAKVLNTDRIMFVDVDLTHHFGGFSFFGLLSDIYKKIMLDDAAKARAQRGQRTKSLAITTNSEKERKIVLYLESYHKKNPDFGARIYRTKAGLRLLITHTYFIPEAADTQKLMRLLGVDPLYAQLCQTQQCFRARLTPKPWRCGLKRPKLRYPFEKHEEALFNKWLADYENKQANFHTCEYLGSIGNINMTSEISTCVRVHDEETGALGPKSIKLA